MLKKEDLDYQIKLASKDGECKLVKAGDGDSDPRSIAEASPAMALYGGAVVQSLLPHALNSPYVGICRTPEWIANRIN